MRLAILPPDEALARAAARWGDLRSEEALADLIRVEVTARGRCLRWTALCRLEQTLSAHLEQARSRLDKACSLLEAQGDITASKGGWLHASPVRAVRIHHGADALICSLPTHRLRDHCPGELEVEGVRRIHRFDASMEAEAESAVHALGGVVLSPEAWAGFDLVAAADQAWLDDLDERLLWHAEAAASLERDGALDWKNLVLSPEGPRWHRSPTEGSELWRARAAHGRWVRAWTKLGADPSTGSFVSLTADDASRTVFALARARDCPISLTITPHEDGVQLRIREWLPRAEYRYLAAIAPASRVDDHFEWTIPQAAATDVLATLAQRLGIDIPPQGTAVTT